MMILTGQSVCCVMLLIARIRVPLRFSSASVGMITVSSGVWSVVMLISFFDAMISCLLGIRGF